MHDDVRLSEQLTGMIVLQGLSACGLVEGPEAEVLSQLEVMATGGWHERFVVLEEDQIPERRFSAWTSLTWPSGSKSNRTQIDYLPGLFIKNLAKRL